MITRLEPRSRGGSSKKLARSGLQRAYAVLLLLAGACAIDPGSGGICPEGTLSCGECVDPATSLLHCGSCDNTCAAGQDCISGQCSCVAGLDVCGAGCANLSEDPLNCGACGTVCATGLVCSLGACSDSCAPGLTACGASCVDVASSPGNCGTCAAVCGAGQVCAAGLCGCTQGRTTCGDSCVDTTQDALHCGACDVACNAGESCVLSVCQLTSVGSGGADGSGGSLGSGGVSTGGTSSGGSTASGGVSSGGTTGTGGATATACAGGGTEPGFYVSGGTLYDDHCQEFVMRGVNYPYAWYSSRNLSNDFAAIAGAGANTVRVVLATGARWTRSTGAVVTTIIDAAKQNELVVVLEVHDMTGWSEQSGSVELSQATSYWTSSDVLSAINGQEAYAIINIANEPMGNNTTADWASRHVTSVTALRNAGIDHTLMVDAPNWGQDWSNTMRDGAGTDQIWNADPDKNLVFSVHMYDVYGTSQTVTAYFNGFLDRSPALPLVVGEFAADHGSSGNVDEATIMALADTMGVGYLGWSWSGNGSDLGTLDITTNFNVNTLTTWGNRLINGTNGLEASSETCSCFD